MTLVTSKDNKEIVPQVEEFWASTRLSYLKEDMAAGCRDN